MATRWLGEDGRIGGVGKKNIARSVYPARMQTPVEVFRPRPRPGSPNDSAGAVGASRHLDPGGRSVDHGTGVGHGPEDGGGSIRRPTGG
jgi:hypothetical protein